MRLAAGMIGAMLLALGSARADEPADKASRVRQGLAFLAKDAVKWKEQHKCVSCHHAGMIVWAMNTAQQSGYDVDEPLLADLTQWIADSGDGRTSVERPANAPKALNSKAIWFSLALNSLAKPSEENAKAHRRLLDTVRSDQLESGAWQAWPETRPPFFGLSDYSATAQAALALSAPAVQAVEFQAARDKAIAWLDAAPIDDETQSLSLRLTLAGRLKQTSMIPELSERLRKLQQADGGWSQTKDLSTDAWATGQAIFALKAAGIDGGHLAVEQGEAFLMHKQREDGSWPMESRPSKPGEKGASNLIPIIGAGSAWAVIGLATEQVKGQ